MEQSKSEVEDLKAELAESLVNIMHQMLREHKYSRQLLSYKLLESKVKYLRQYSLYLESSEWIPPASMQKPLYRDIISAIDEFNKKKK